jgi:hypothetical protein
MKGRALFERNAAACETAKHSKCVCACGGALHGVAHSTEWRASTWALLVAEAEAATEAAAGQASIFNVMSEV